MYRVQKTLEISSAHCLSLPYPSKCKKMHGHNWKITVTVCGKVLNAEGMLLDFVHIKEAVQRLDHLCLNDCFAQPTAEHIAFGIAEELDKLIAVLWNHVVDRPWVESVSVQESEGNIVHYTAGDEE